MFETPIHLIGNIVNDPIRRRVGDQEVARFRVASNSRRRTADGAWEAGNSLFVTVNCWGRLASGVGASLTKGDPVVVVGQIYTSEYEDRAGNRRSSVEVRANSVGPDLTRCTARVESPKRSAAALADASSADEAPTAVDGEQRADDADDADDADAAGEEARGDEADGRGLPLSA